MKRHKIKRPKPAQAEDEEARRRRALPWIAVQLCYYLPHDRGEAIEVLDLTREIVSGFGTGKSDRAGARFDKWFVALNPYATATPRREP